MKKIALFIFCIISLFKSKSQNPSWEWAKSTIITSATNGTANGAARTNLCDLDIDNNNIYLSIPTAGLVNILNSTSMYSPYGYINFLIKTDLNGNFLRLDTVGTESGSIKVDKKTGNLFFAGMFNKTVIAGTNTYPGNGGINYDICVIKYDNNGNVLWSDRASSNGMDRMDNHMLTLDDSANCIITGTFQNNTMSFQTITLNPLGPQNCFLTKYNTNGSVVWSKQIGGAGCSIYTPSICSDKNGDIYVSGLFSNAPVNIGSFILSPTAVSPNKDIFLSKFDSNGNALWAKQIQYSGSLCGSDGHGISNMVVNEHGLLVTGTFNTSINFGNNVSLTNSGDCDMFAAKYDLNGNLKFVKHGKGNGEESGKGISTDSIGNIYVTGSSKLGGTAIFDNLSIFYPSNSYTLYVAKYDSLGYIKWIKKTTNISGGSVSESIVCNSPNECFIAGGIVYSVAFDNTTLSTASFPTDLILAKLKDTTTTSINENAYFSDVNIFPNPSNDFITVDINNPIKKNTEINIYNLYGQKVKTIKNIEPKTIIPRGNLADGIYFICVSDDSKIIINEKFVIQNK